ncbi:hypothetical protein OAS35_01740 [Pelagibacteraceae bacterium]|nr:hypothetical protein [Pelagibacteraceae bacterium]
MKIFILLIIILYPFSAFSLEKTKSEKVAKYIITNIQKDYVACYSFYKVGTEIFKKTKKDKKIIEGLEKSADVALKFNYDLGEVLGLKPKFMAQTTKIEVKKFTKIAQNNFQSLAKKYGLMCKKLVENQQQRIDYWGKKGNEKIK